MIKYTETQLLSIVGCILKVQDKEVVIHQVLPRLEASVNGVKLKRISSLFKEEFNESLIYLTDEDDSPLVSLDYFFNFHGQT